MLTDTQCKQAQPGAKERKLSDAYGLYLSILPSGTKSWRVKYRFAGRENRLVLGRYPLITLKKARELRDAARAQLAMGIDPGAEKRKAKARIAEADTFEAIARAWHRHKQRSLTPRYAQHVLTRLESNIFPAFGSVAIRDITPPIVLNALRRIEARGSHTMAHEVRGHVSDVFVWAIGSGLAEQDPAAIVRKAMAPAGGGRRPAVITIEEARSVLIMAEAVPKAYWSTLMASRMIALTAARPGMVRQAEPSEFEGLDGQDPIWRVPAEKMKLTKARKADTANDFILPLAPQAVALVKAAMKANAGTSPWLFPAEYGRKPMSDSTVSALYRDAGFAGRHVPHGWRATFSTVMNERAAHEAREQDRAIIDLMLAHIPSGVEAAYNRAAYMPRRRELACHWADMLIQGLPDPETFFTGPRRKRR